MNEFRIVQDILRLSNEQYERYMSDQYYALAMGGPDARSFAEDHKETMQCAKYSDISDVGPIGCPVEELNMLPARLIMEKGYTPNEVLSLMTQVISESLILRP